MKSESCESMEDSFKMEDSIIPDCSIIGEPLNEGRRYMNFEILTYLPIHPNPQKIKKGFLTFVLRKVHFTVAYMKLQIHTGAHFDR